jgi:galactonate dehydratase
MTRRSLLTLGVAGTAGLRFEAAAEKVPPKLRVTKVDPVIIRAARNPGGWILVRVKTSEGIEGIGECASRRSSTVARVTDIRDMVDSIGVRLSGGNPLQIWSHLEHWAREASGLDWAAAMSGIEIALWDILGQVAGLPVYQVLGGAVRDRIPLYANDGAFGGATDPEERLRRALRMKEAGYRMFKWDPFRGSVDDSFKEVRLFRDAFGVDFRLAIDMNGRFTGVTAVGVIKRLEEFRPAFIEGSLPLDQLELHREIASSTSVLLASGELLPSYRVAKRVVDSGGIRLLQPDVASCGGMLEFTRIAGYAEICGVQLAPHGWCGPVATRANTHASAIARNLLAQEYPATAPEDAWENDLIEPGPVVANGEMELPTGPGLGFRLNEKLLASRRVI